MRHSGLGFTLLELMVVVAVIAIVIVIAQPSFQETIDRRRMEGAGGELATDLQYARSLAAARNTSVYLATNASGNGYTIADSTGGTTHRTVTLADSLTVPVNTTATFDSVRGASNAVDITISSTLSSNTLRVSTNAVGRVQMCIPSGTLPGYSAC